MHHRLAGRAHLADGVGGIEHGAGRAGLGHAPALDQRHAARRPAFEDGERAGRAADAGDPQPREVGALELRMLHHELVGRRHAEEVGDAERRVGDVVERQAGLEGAHDQDRAAGMQHGIGVAVEAAGMEQRQDHELHGLRRDQRRDAEVDGVPEHHAVGDDRALGMAGGARGVHDHADVVVRQRHGRRHRRARRQRALVGAVGSSGSISSRFFDSAVACCAKRLVVDQQLGRRIAQDVLELRHGEPPVERQHDRAEPPAGELQLEVFRAVGRQQRHAVALADALRRQPAGEPVGAAVQLGVGERPVGLQVVDRELVGPAMGVVGDPVVVGRDAGHRQFTALVKPFQ